MGQYFYLFNRTKHEYVSPPGLVKAVERMTSAKNGAVITYLLLDGPVDGTGPLLGAVGNRLYEQHDFDSKDEVYDLFMEIRGDDFDTEEDARERFEDEWTHFFEADEDSIASPAQFARILASHLDISEATDYGGRWVGDEIAYVGDYAEGEWEYSDRENYDDITENVVGEINWWTDGWLDSSDQSTIMAPDMIFTI